MMGIEFEVTKVRQKFSSQAPPELLADMRGIAEQEGRHFQAVLEEAMEQYVARHKQDSVRPEMMAHFYASLERNRRLYGLLAK